MSKKKKALLMTMASTLAASTALTGLPVAQAETVDSKLPNSKSVAPLATPQKALPKIPAKFEQPADVKEIVRVIVELDKAPAISEATAQGLSYKDLSTSSKASAEAAVEKQQASVQAAMKLAIGDFDVKQSFTTVFNGFSLEVKAGDVKKIAKLQGVKAVYESQEYKRPEVEPEMITSKELVQAQLAWDKYSYRGEGAVVAVIDSGIDPNHKDFQLTDDSTGEITSDEVSAHVEAGDVSGGKYFSAKIPFGYNYMDDNQEVKDIAPGASMHGQHVSGTVGANGDETNGGIQGVAPEAQILAMKVFGNDQNFGSTFGDVYVKAIDDSIKLGADVINMSLGATAGFVDNASPEQQAVARAKENGLIVSISAGNSDMYGSGFDYNDATDQDYGLTGSPSVSEGSLGVASFENTDIAAVGFNYAADGVDAGEAMFLLANDVEPAQGVDYDVVYAGLGTAADYEGLDVEGKFVLVSRGAIAFVEKGLNAQAAGAAGIIVHNNTEGTINMVSDPAIQIPYMSSLQADGLAMKALIDDGKAVTVRFDGEVISTPNPEAGLMSSFTSWGPTPNLDFKPEITAPGGNIYSTMNDDQYGLMSGTSMAAPHVAGGSALIFERVDNDFDLSGYDRAQRAKNLLMNTSKPVVFAEYDGITEFVSPRRQGAGIMQLADALETDVIVYEKNTGEGKVALKEIADGQFQFTLTAENFSDTEKVYDLSLQLQTDYAAALGDRVVTAPNEIGSVVLEEGTDYTSDAPGTVTVAPNSTQEFTVNVSLTGAQELMDVFTNGFFVDGFVQLTDSTPEEGETENLPTLTVPFFGFNGSWDDAPIFDDNFWEETSKYGIHGMIATKEGYSLPGKTFEDKSYDYTTVAFSPNGDGVFDTALPIFSLKRNVKNFEVNILDKDGKKLRTIGTSKNLRKHYDPTSSYYTFNPLYAWDGKINGKTPVEGEYQIEIKAVIDFEGAEWQSMTYPIKLDLTAPTLAVDVDTTEEVMSFETADNLSGVDVIDVYVEDELVDTLIADETGAVSAFDYSEVTPGDDVTFVAYDVAGNATEVTKRVASTEYETNVPNIIWETPDYLAFFDSSEVEFTGQVTDDSGVVTVTVGGEQADEFDGTNYAHTLTLADGVHKVKVAATDEHGNVFDIQRQVGVDTTAPTLDVSDVPEEAPLDATSVTADLVVGDNFDEVRVYVNGDEVFFNELSEPYELKDYSETVEVELPVEDGINEFEVKVVDVVGNATTETVTVDVTEEFGKTVIDAEDVQPFIDSEEGYATFDLSELADGETETVELTREAVELLVENWYSLELMYGPEASYFYSYETLEAWLATDADRYVIDLTKNGFIDQTDAVATKLTGDYTLEVSVKKGDEVTPVTDLAGMVVVALQLDTDVTDERKAAAYHVAENLAQTYSGGFVFDSTIVFLAKKTGTYTAYEKDVTFPDIEKHWSRDYVEVLASRSIIFGKSETKFAPNDQVTRAEFAVLISRAMNLPLNEYSGVFKDVTEAQAWSYQHIEAAYEAGIVSGRTPDTFAPTAQITRQEMASMIVRAAEYMYPGFSDEYEGRHKFADDSKIAEWAKEDVKTAYEAGIISGRPDNSFDPRSNATRGESATMLYMLLTTLGEF
ncbi:lactocepin [Chryseomicrobium excrementi]|uniref:Lactocepin n=1 Tax=Chryseomicrobium excrementi TaxID=2041346 RepID=A0A2M9F0B5_9BACL|nr:S8 family serine peptidase [Chryseomicrobium excrementi]PJK16902.1 lactocepin [Chryseomicrobium excrementi]